MTHPKSALTHMTNYRHCENSFCRKNVLLFGATLSFDAPPIPSRSPHHVSAPRTRWAPDRWTYWSAWFAAILSTNHEISCDLGPPEATRSQDQADGQWTYGDQGKNRWHCPRRGVGSWIKYHDIISHIIYIYILYTSWYGIHKKSQDTWQPLGIGSIWKPLYWSIRTCSRWTLKTS